MKQNNCKSENVRAGDAEGKLAAASPASLAVPTGRTPFPCHLAHSPFCTLINFHPRPNE